MDIYHGDLTQAMQFELEQSGVTPDLCMELSSAGRHSRGLILAAVSGVRNDRTVSCAVAVEMLHRASVIRDDVQDGDTVRRGRATVHAKYGIPHALAIVDLLISLGFDLLYRAAGERAARLALDCYRDMAVGQCLDLAEILVAERAVIDDPAKMKTGSLVSLCFRLGGLLAGLNRSQIESLGEVGMHLGTAFQLFNDIHNVTADEGRRRDVGSDLALGRSSAVALALRHAISAGSSVTDRDLGQALSTVEKIANDHLKEASRKAATVNLPTAILALILDPALGVQFVADQVPLNRLE